MVIALSPHFQRASKDPHVKAQFQALLKSGRLDFALQIPNAPILPLLMEDPPHGYPDDVIQLIAQAKAGFFKQWNYLPKGLVVPYGAADAKLIALLEKLGLTWVVAAVEAPPVDGPYQSGSLMVWDAAPSKAPVGTMIHVWDERQMKEHPLETWINDARTKAWTFLLPQDTSVIATPTSAALIFKSRTWTDSNLSIWTGSPAKNAAWGALRKTREALEKYKNSGQASVQRLDIAFEEIYSAQNSNYFSSLDNATVSPALAEERSHEFQATLMGIYRMIGKTPPDDLFQATAAGATSTVKASSTTIRAETYPDGREHVMIEDAVGDAIFPGGPDLKSLEVLATTDSIHWSMTLAAPSTSAVIDIYLDLNNQPNAGTPTFLTGRKFMTAPARRVGIRDDVLRTDGHALPHTGRGSLRCGANLSGDHSWQQLPNRHSARRHARFA